MWARSNRCKIVTFGKTFHFKWHFCDYYCRCCFQLSNVPPFINWTHLVFTVSTQLLLMMMKVKTKKSKMAHLSQILNGVDVMMRRRADKSYPWDRFASLGNFLGHLKISLDSTTLTKTRGQPLHLPTWLVFVWLTGSYSNISCTALKLKDSPK